MRQTLLIVMLSLLFGQVGCWRKHSDRVNADLSTRSTTTTEEDQSQALVYLDKGKEFYRGDQDQKAAAAFQEAIKLDPGLAEAHFRLGLARDALGEEKEAEESYKRAVETYRTYLEENSKDAEGHYNLGQTYAGLHLYVEAVREYRQATHLKPDDADMYYDLGVALMRLAQYEEAAAAFSKSLEIDPENYRAQDELDEARAGVNRIRAGKKHQEELLKKQKEEEVKKQQGEEPSPASEAKPGNTIKPSGGPENEKEK